MGSLIAPVFSLLSGIGILLLGAGLQGTLVAVRAHAEAFSVAATGLIMSVYYAGYIVGYFVSPAIVRRVGHIRAYSALTAIASAIVLLYPIFVDVPVWFVLRLVSGICFAGIYMVVESWLNGVTTNATRGTILGLYMMVNLGALAAGQLLLMVYDPAGFQLFLVASALVSIGLVPVALTRHAAPAITAPGALPPAKLYAASPLGVIGCFATGLSLGAFWGVGPLYAVGIGIPAAGVALFMSITILGGMVLQWPIGWLSDRVDRRRVIVGVTFGIAAISTALAAMSHLRLGAELALALLFGGFAFSLYSLCVAHANDYIADEDKVAASSGLLLVYGTGAAIGPFSASLLMRAIGPEGLFVFAATASLAVGLFGAYRMGVRASAPVEEQSKFVPLPRTSPVVLALDPRAEPLPAEGEAAVENQDLPAPERERPPDQP